MRGGLEGEIAMIAMGSKRGKELGTFRPILRALRQFQEFGMHDTSHLTAPRVALTLEAESLDNLK
jgi:hypothetical protein